jgi:hypothetical protein
MDASFAERREQINALLNVRTEENDERVGEELKRTILTVHVPHEVQEALAEIVKPLQAPIIMRLSNVGAVANPLAPTMIIGLDEPKRMLDAVRMLYDEMYSEENLELGEDDRSAAIIIQEQPAVSATWRIIRHGRNTFVEGTRGLGAWVGVGEPDRFLFLDGAFSKAENGDDHGIEWQGALEKFTRTPLGGEEATKLLEFAKPYLDTCSQPLLFASTESGFVCLGAGAALP